MRTTDTWVASESGALRSHSAPAPTERVARRHIAFDSRGERCEAWFYPGSNGGCLVMAAGLAVTKEPGTDRIATAVNRAGFSVLAFDYRRLGGSSGQPRQYIRLRDQLDDWHSALQCAQEQTEVDGSRIAIWGFSLSGGHVFRVAADRPDLAAAIATSPLTDGLEALRHALPSMTLGAILRMGALAASDLVRRGLRRSPVLIPLTGDRGDVAALTTPDSRNGPIALDPVGEYAHVWPQQVAAWSALRVGFYRPGRIARQIKPPLLVISHDEDGVAPPGSARRAGEAAPGAEVINLPGGHYALFLDDGTFDRVIDATLQFLARHVLR